MHTTETDGRATLEEMAEAARALGYEYIAITDHSKALAMANGLDEKRAVAFAKHVRELNQDGLGIRIFSGLECDIRRDGAMDLAEDALAELDIVVGSVHSHMNLEAAEMTDRLMRALESPSLRVLGHPTGRHSAESRSVSRSISSASRRRRCGATSIWKSTAARSGWILAGAMVRTAKALGAKFAISTDSHQTKHLGHQHAVRRDHGAARVAGSARRPEHAAAAEVRKSDSQIMKIISSVEKYKNTLFSVSEDHAVDPDGFEIRRAIVHHRGSAVMMAVDDRKRILLVRQYRLPRAALSVGTARRAPGPRRNAAAGRQARAEGRDRLSRQEVEEAGARFIRAPASSPKR